MMDIYTLGDEVLRVKALPVEQVDDTFRTTLENMVKTMHVARGVGLAAPQEIGRAHV